MEAEKARTQLEMEKQRQQTQIEHEKFEREAQRQKTDFEQQMKQLEAKREADSDAFQRDLELHRMETQRALDEQRLQMEEYRQANNHAAPPVRQEREVFEQNVRLPKFSLPTFSGNFLQWKGFWDSFLAAVYNKSSVSSINKFYYLKSNLEGQALVAVSGFELSKENYERAVQMLKTRFGDTNRILEAHYSQLQQLFSVSNQLFPLHTFVATFELDLRALEARGEWTDSKCVFIWLRTQRIRTVFVENRRKELKARKDLEFRYVLTSENAADIGSRACSFHELLSGKWFKGPEWLIADESEWPTTQLTVDTNTLDNIRSELSLREQHKWEVKQKHPLKKKHPQVGVG